MSVWKEIINNSDKADKQVLKDLFSKYHWQSQWNFVAKLTVTHIGPRAYDFKRQWKPTYEGRVLWGDMKRQELRNG